MIEWLELGAVIFSGLFAGGATYVSVVEQPVREEADAAASLGTFKVLFHKAARFQIPLLVISILCATGALYFSGNWAWIGGIAAMIFIIPYTILVLMPLNRTLLASEADHPELKSLLKNWAPLHLVRTLIGLASFILYTSLAILAG
jgi:hypothetical protein